jgi:hypothetical protein
MTSSPTPRTGRLLSADASVLLIVDVQEHFLRKLDRHVAVAVTDRIAWLAALATWLDIPIIATAEELDHHGGTVAPIARELPPAAPTFDKPIFGVADNPTIRDAIAATGRGTAVLVGLETDVCILQSGLRAARPGVSSRGGAGCGRVTGRGAPGRTQSDARARRGAAHRQGPVLRVDAYGRAGRRVSCSAR